MSHAHKWVTYDLDSAMKKLCEIIQLDIAHNMIAASSKMWTATPRSAELTAPIKMPNSDSEVQGVIVVRLVDKPAARSATLSLGRKLSNHHKMVETVRWDGTTSARTLMAVIGEWTGGA
jgi:hypothetical protein